jgi:hypothetical protein
VKACCVKHAAGHVQQGAVHAFRNSILLRSVGWTGFLARTFRLKHALEGLVEELSSSVCANSA